MNNIIEVSTIILLVVLIVWDVFPFAVLGFSRFRKGLLVNDDSYYAAVKRIGLLWLKRRRGVRGVDFKSPIELLFLLVLGFRNSLIIRDSWPQAILTKAFARSLHAEGDNKRELTTLIKYSNAFISRNSKGGKLRIKTLEQVIYGEVFLYLYEKTHNEKYKIACDDIITYLFERKQIEGPTLAYGRGTEDQKGNRLVDSLPMICPFLCAWGSTFGRNDAIEFALKQIKDFAKYAIESNTGLPFHAYAPCFDNAPLGLIGWGRGTGWYAWGLIETYKALNTLHPARKELMNLMLNLAKKIPIYSKPDGGWGCLLTSRNSKYDTSATALLTLFIVEVRKETNSLDGEYWNRIIENAITSIKVHTKRNGTIDSAQGNCNGFDQMASVSRPQVFAQGLVLLLLVAIRSIN